MIWQRFKDGLNDCLSAITNRRNASNRNSFESSFLSQDELKAIYKTGTANKIFRIKAGSALTKTIQFNSKEDEEIYEAKIEKAVRKACIFQLAFGRGIILIHENGAVLDQPLSANWDKSKYKLDVFSGDMVTVSEVERDLASERYYKPKYYQVRGHRLHHSRVIDFTYVEPLELDAPNYSYGGISESELIYDQLVNDGIVERSSASIIEKNSSFFYKVKGFKQLITSKQEEGVIKYISAMEDHRSIYGAGIVDMEDDVESITQALTNLKEVDDISLRR